ncbi:MAG: hypothetical protein AUI14_15180 [Actinobacteria bacterium 13_2_20CM_2_71_6]|nr:MAG: hypothetical protein AUI14_15180 [Actinobacteria bacterium 13_2_20CM_2_71_6]
MPLGPQRKDARGTAGQPYSALNLRLVFACFGAVSCAVLAGVLLWLGYRVAAVPLAVLALVALVDIVVIQRRRRARRRVDPGEHSLFE